MNFETCTFEANGKTIKGLNMIGSTVTQRNPTHTIILLDTSGSMSEDSKLKNVKKSLQYLIKFLLPSDFLSLITFSHISKIIFENVSVNSYTSQALDVTIFNLHANGGTNLSAGLFNVRTILERVQTSHIKTSLIILTDGHTNEGITHNQELINIIQSIKNIRSDITMNSIGYGEDHNANLLKDIAIHGNGGYSIVNDLESVATVFGEVLGGMMSCVAQNTTVSISSSWNCFNIYSKSTNNNTTIIDIGDIYAETETILLFEGGSGSATINSVNTSTYQTINHTTDFTNNTDNKEPYMFAFIRSLLSHLLTNLKKQDQSTNLNSLNTIKTLLQTVVGSTNILLPFLNEQVKNIELQITQPNTYMNDSQILQTSAFLGLGRGISTPARPVRQFRRQSVGDIIEQLNNTTIYTPFSNQVQRSITNTLNNTLSQDPMN